MIGALPRSAVDFEVASLVHAVWSVPLIVSLYEYRLS